MRDLERAPFQLGQTASVSRDLRTHRASAHDPPRLTCCEVTLTHHRGEHTLVLASTGDVYAGPQLDDQPRRRDLRRPAPSRVTAVSSSARSAREDYPCC